MRSCPPPTASAALPHQLDKLAKERKDPGLLYDCLLFHDGTHWRAVVDPVTSDGDLRSARALAPFPVAQDHAVLDSACAFCGPGAGTRSLDPSLAAHRAPRRLPAQP